MKHSGTRKQKPVRKLMQPLINRILVLLLLQAATTATFAQQSSFTLEDAIRYALEKHANVKNAMLDERIAERRVDELTGAGTPQIRFNSEVNNFIDIPVSFVPGEFFGAEPGVYIPVQFGQQYSMSGGFTFSQLLFDGSYLVGLQAARTYRELSLKKTKQTRTEVAVNVTKAYYGALVSDARLDIIEANLQRVEKLLNETRALNKAGFVEKVDVDRMELTYNNLLVEKEKVMNFKALSYLLLKYNMSYPYQDQIVLAERLEEIAKKKTTVPDKVNLDNRPEYEVLTVSRKMQELDVKLSKSGQMPNLVAFGTFSYNNARNQFDFFTGGLRWFPTTLIGAKLSLPIWTGLQNKSKVSQSRLTLEKIDNALDLMRNSFQLELDQAKTNYRNNLLSLDFVRKNRELAKEISRVAKTKYDNGLGSSLEMVNAESDVREADANFFNVLYDTLISQIELERISGSIAF